MYYVYLLKSTKYKKSYVGYTDNTERRIKEHNIGRCVFTRKYRLWKLIYREKFFEKKKAKQRERYFKSASGRRFLKKLF